MGHRRNYLLAVLFAVQIFYNVDGMALGLVLQDIKRDLVLSDTQLSLLTGLAFTLMYSLAGLAIARWADRGDRVAIISLAAAVWSVLVAACGLAANFVQLFLLRAAVGIGEAGCMPASQSLIADYFDRASRPRAYAIYMVAGSVTSVVGFSLAGWLNQLYGWRVMFTILGLPGVAIAALVWFTLRDPRFEKSYNDEAHGWIAHAFRSPLKTTVGAAAPSVKEAAVTLWFNITLRQLLFFWLTWGFLGSALGSWLPSFFERSYGLNTGELGTLFAVSLGVGGMLGPLLASAWVSRYAVNNERLQLKSMAVAICAITLVSSFIYLVHSYYVAFVLVGLYAFITNGICGPFWATVQTLVPANMRAAVVAMFMLLSNVVGMGLGSLTTGALSDALRTQIGSESLRYASLALCPGFLLLACHLWRASRSVTNDLTAVEKPSDGHCGGPCTARAAPSASM